MSLHINRAIAFANSSQLNGTLDSQTCCSHTIDENSFIIQYSQITRFYCKMDRHYENSQGIKAICLEITIPRK